MATRAGDRVFLDTNVLLCASDSSREQHSHALELIANAAHTGIHLFVSGQILREYLVVATRPTDRNGLGLTPAQGLENIEQISRRAGMIEETVEVAGRLRKLIRQNDLHGKRIHDANIVATMASQGVEILVTENRRDFAGIAPLRIMEIAQAADELRRS